MKNFIAKIFLVILSPFMFIELLYRNSKYSFKTGFTTHIWLLINRVKYGNGFYFHTPLYLYQRSNLEVGQYCSFGEYTKIWNYQKITIGDHFLGAPNLTLLTGGHDPDNLTGIFKPISIGDRVWCGANVTVLPGVKIGNDVSIAAGSLVTRDIPCMVIVAGVPAKIIRKIDIDKRRNILQLRTK